MFKIGDKIILTSMPLGGFPYGASPLKARLFKEKTVGTVIRIMELDRLYPNGRLKATFGKDNNAGSGYTFDFDVCKKASKPIIVVKLNKRRT